MNPVDPPSLRVQPARVGPLPPPAKEPPPRSWIVLLVAVWVLVLVAGAGWAILHPQATDREQTTVAEAKPAVDESIARIAAAATVDGQAVAVLSDFAKVGDCRVTVFRAGQRYDREVTVIVPAGAEAALMRRVADRLPRSYGVELDGGSRPLFFADAGDFVRLTGAVTSPGQVRFVADTGACRRSGELPASPTFVGDRSVIAPVLSKLELSGPQWYAYQVSCPGGGTLSTVEAVGPDGVVPGTVDLPAALSGLGSPVVSAPELFAYRIGSTGIAVRVQNRRLVVTATTGC